MLRRLLNKIPSLNQVQAGGTTTQEQLRVAQTIFNNTQPVLVTDARARILRMNASFCTMTGYQPEEMLGRTPRMFRSNHHDQAFYDHMLATIKTAGHWEGEVWDRRKDGQILPKWMSITTVPDASGEITHMVACYTDLSSQHQAQQTIHQLAFYDVLTKLPNRNLLRERVQHAQTEAQRLGRWGALLLLDWDNFKFLNDSLGYPQGDALLQQIATRLTASLPQNTTVARLGGDEYAVVMPLCDKGLTQAAAQAESLAGQVQRTLALPYKIAEIDYQGSASLGIVLFADDQSDPDTLLKQAELAMYQAKQEGHGLLHFFDEALEQQINERLQMEHALRGGIERGELRLHYQPQITLDAGVFKLTGAEALVRWQHPQRGLLGPGLFIPLAEDTDLIQPLGLWVLEQACRELKKWQQQPATAELTMAVNVSATQFLHPDFVSQLLSLLQDTGAPPQYLKLELTESVLMESTTTAIATMTALRAQKIRFSLDDFGTGYSSLQYIKSLPLDQLKIDRSFVQDLQTNPNDAAIANSIIALADSLGLGVIAEGVETRSQQRLLAAMGCNNYQGFGFSKPLASAAFEAYCLSTIGFARAHKS